MKYLLLCALFFSANLIHANDALVGIWLTGNKKGKVEIWKSENQYNGKLIWVNEPKDESGNWKLDDQNPEESLRARKILGLPLLNGFVYDEDNVWEDGTIYDPESGKTYSCKITLLEDGRLEVRGFIGFSLIGRSDYWTPTTLE